MSADNTVKQSDWIRLCALHITHGNCLFVGSRFKESDIDAAIRSRRLWDGQEQTGKNWIILDEFNSLEKTSYERKGITPLKATAEEYPTSQSTNGVEIKCLKLTTCETGYWGSLLGMPIAAGNLFLGSFEVRPTDILRSTKFGTPFSNIPTSITGYYKYKAGKSFQIDGKPVDNKKDICDIYAVFYETDEKLSTLDGTNILAEDNTHIVSVARIKDAKETDEWIKFDLPFEYRTGKSVDMEKLKAGKYNLAIVFSSSIRGDHFEGAPGSTLYIDEVLLNFTNK